MSDIQRGDLVVCVNTSDADCPNALRRKALARLIKGRAYRVTGLSLEPTVRTLCLHLDGVGNADIEPRWGDRWQAFRFRKLNDEADDAELIARIKQCKPACIPTLEPIQTLPVRLDPGVWPLDEEN